MRIKFSQNYGIKVWEKVAYNSYIEQTLTVYTGITCICTIVEQLIVSMKRKIFLASSYNIFNGWENI